MIKEKDREGVKKPTAFQRISFLLSLKSFSLLSSLFEGWFSLDAGKEIELRWVLTNALDSSLSLKLLDDGTSDRTVYLELVHEDAASNAKNLGDFACNFCPSFFVKEHIVVKLVLYLYLGPGLLLWLCAFTSNASLFSCLSALGGTLSCIFRALLSFSLHKKLVKVLKRCLLDRETPRRI